MNYLEPLIAEFENSADPIRAAGMKRYLKGLFEFYGFDAKTRRYIQSEFFKKYGFPEREQLFPVVLQLWELPFREFQHCAVELLFKLNKQLKESDIQYIEKLIITKSWWDTVDGLSSWVCGKYFVFYPNQIPNITESWMNSGNMWLQRSILLFQLKYKKNTDTELLSKSIIRLADHKEFFIRKAIGWILREYSKTDEVWVREFVNQHKLSALSYREATKYC